MRLTKTIVAGLQPKSAAYAVYDDTLPSFGVRVYPTGIKSYVVEYRPRGSGRTAAKKRATIGSVDILTSEEAAGAPAKSWRKWRRAATRWPRRRSAGKKKRSPPSPHRGSRIMFGRSAPAKRWKCIRRCSTRTSCPRSARASSRTSGVSTSRDCTRSSRGRRRRWPIACSRPSRPFGVGRPVATSATPTRIPHEESKGIRSKAASVS